MLQRILFMGALGLAAIGAVACGDDDDGGGGGGSACAHAEMVCMDDPDTTIDCSMFGSAPASVQDCVGGAADCDAVFECLLSADEGAAGAAAD